MSQVSIKDLEINGKRNQNKNLKNLAVQREQERKTWEAKSQAWEAKCQEMLTKTDKLIKHVTWHSSLQGAKHIIWDVIITETNKLRPYLDYILDKEIVTQVAKQSVLLVKQVLNKKSRDTTQNEISFLNSLKK